MCGCIEKVNELLGAYNTELNLPLCTSSGRTRPLIETRKRDSSKRGKPKSLFASFCPFCGGEYADPGNGHAPAEDSITEGV